MSKAILPTFCGLLAAVAHGGVLAQTDPTRAEPMTEMSLGDGVSVYLGARGWANTWSVAVPVPKVPTMSPSGDQILQDILLQADSDLEFIPMVTGAIRWKNFIATATYSIPTDYGFSDSFLPGFSARRDELDVNIGYFVLPSLIVSLGYRSADGHFNNGNDDDEFSVDGAILGIAGSAPLSEQWSLYGNLGYGVAREKFETPLANGERTLDNLRYAIGEIGVTYRFFSAPEKMLKGLQLSFGYRFQQLTLPNLPLGTYSPTAPNTPLSIRYVDSSTTTSGFILGLIGTF